MPGTASSNFRKAVHQTVSDAPSSQSHNHVRIEFLVRVPPADPKWSEVFVAGNHERLGHWRADGLKLTPLRSGPHGEAEFHGAIDVPRGHTIEYKITRGRWDAVERSAAGQNVPNRRLLADAGTLQLITVERW
jgi:hypothetical protein